jgi:hypothetical protein
MWDELSIRNFRAFKELTLGPLGRVNIIVGGNNTGKTCVLEAGFILAGFYNAEVPFNLNALRGKTLVPMDPRDVWGWLFHNKDLAARTEVTGTCKEDSERIRLKLAPTTGSTRPAGGEAPVSGAVSETENTPLELRCTYHHSKGKTHQTTGRMQRSEKGELQLVFEGTEARVGYGSIFVPARQRTPYDDAEKFLRLVNNKRKAEVLTWLRRLDSRISDLSVEPEGPRYAVTADLGLAKYIPLVFAGEGSVRFLSILVSMLSAGSAYLFIDEIDSGLHHEAYPALWQAVFDLARATGNQVFATTHSWECLQAAHEVAKARAPYELSAFRLERTSEHEVKAVALTQQGLEFAVNAGMEVR